MYRTLHLGKHCLSSRSRPVLLIEWLVWNSVLVMAYADTVLFTLVSPESGTKQDLSKYFLNE